MEHSGSNVVTPIAPLSQQAGYYCPVSECMGKDSANYLDHINGKKHQMALDMSMRVEHASLQRVQERDESLEKRKAPGSFTEQGVGNCYVFKSRLQEYAQKAGITSPVYQTVKEGPSHEPVFKSTVTVNDVTYDSLPGFFNRKASEQSAAEVALIEIHKSGTLTENIPMVHETGLCKNLLQEYAQKMNYAVPSYKCSRQEEGAHPFICTVEIGGIQYIGAAARSKKEAEIKAARTALLAIKDGSDKGANGVSLYTVLPTKKKGMEQESGTKAEEQRKPKKRKKIWSKKRKFPRNKGDKAEKSENEPPNPIDKGEPLNPIDKGEDASMACARGESEQGSGVMNDVPQSQVSELMASAMENGVSKDEKQDGSITCSAERFDETSN